MAKYILLITILLYTLSCSDGRQSYTSERYNDINAARIIYKGRNYPKARRMLKDLLEQGVITGDVLYYYGFCLAEDEKYREAEHNYRKAISWFEKYRSEFPEDKNFDKAIYNYGIIYFKEESPVQDLNAVKKIWDYGLARNPDNEYINNEYEKLLIRLDFEELVYARDSFVEEYESIMTLAELEALDQKYRKIVENANLSSYNLIIRDIPEELLEFIQDYDKYIQDKRESLSL